MPVSAVKLSSTWVDVVRPVVDVDDALGGSDPPDEEGDEENQDGAEHDRGRAVLRAGVYD